MNEPTTEFGATIRSFRARHGLNQAEFAALIDQSPRAVWDWENGKMPKLPTRLGVAEIMRRHEAGKEVRA